MTLPPTRHGFTTHIVGHLADFREVDAYVTTNFVDGQPVEILITIAKCNSTFRGMFGVIARQASAMLQRGEQVEAVIADWRGRSFDGGDVLDKMADAVAAAVDRQRITM